MNFLKVNIKGMKYLQNNEFDGLGFTHPSQRTMDRFSKKALYLAQNLFEKVDYSSLDLGRIGVVLCTYTGPVASVKEHAFIIKLKGYKGINPSRFPNTMLSTALSLVVTSLGIKGPSIAMYLDESIEHAFKYGIIQLEKKVCDMMMILLVNENDDDFGVCFTNIN